MRIEILYFDGCPNHAPTMELVREVVADLGITAAVEGVELRDAADAERHRFLGSPTVRVNGMDIEPAARDRNDYAYGCRMYGHSGVPPRGLLEAALKEVSR